MKKGDRFVVLAYNCVEWLEIYAAAAKGGFVCVPIMFRLAQPEMEYIINHCEAKVFIVEDQWIKTADAMRKNLPTIEQYVSFAVGNDHFDGYLAYEDIMAAASPAEPETVVTGDDTWVIMYTGGTTGTSKGAMLTHANLVSNVVSAGKIIVTEPNDVSLSFLPLCHVLERMGGYYLMLHAGVSIAYAGRFPDAIHTQRLVSAWPRFVSA